jgi:hypothetical protein
MVPQLSAAVCVFLCTRPTDMRKSFDGLSGLVQECFGAGLLTGHLFLFLNRRGDRIKILYFDRNGLAVWYKRVCGNRAAPAGFDGRLVPTRSEGGPGGGRAEDPLLRSAGAALRAGLRSGLASVGGVGRVDSRASPV